MCHSYLELASCDVRLLVCGCGCLIACRDRSHLHENRRYKEEQRRQQHAAFFNVGVARRRSTELGETATDSYKSHFLSLRFSFFPHSLSSRFSFSISRQHEFDRVATATLRWSWISHLSKQPCHPWMTWTFRADVDVFELALLLMVKKKSNQRSQLDEEISSSVKCELLWGKSVSLLWKKVREKWTKTFY